MRWKSILYYGLGLIFSVYLFGNLISTVRRNYDLKLQIATVEQENAVLKAQNDQLRYQITYYQTPEFAEKEARAKLGLQQPGENVIILPGTQAKSQQAPVSMPKPAPQSNFRQWLSFLFG